MGKKNKKLKKKKPMSPIIGQQMPESSSVGNVSANTHAAPSQSIKTPAAPVVESAEFQHVRKDVKKIMTLLLIIIIVLIILYFVDQKTTILSSAGDWIYKILNIQTQ